MTNKYTGSCLCGAVKYEYDPSFRPFMTVICHCLDCQRYSGTGFGVYVFIPSAGFKQEGDVRSFEVEVAPGRINQRSFCPTCGSHMAEYGAAFPEVVILPAGTLDDASWIKPTAQWFTRSRRHWADLTGDMDLFEAQPDRPAG